jgi:ubiquinone/menaquinone biosynthesis C-methylase UbiE
MKLDSRFAGSIPATYEQCLVPVLFAPYAQDLVARAIALAPSVVLEIAAGTGAVSHALAFGLPDARIVATDLNPAMLEVAAQRPAAPNLSFQPADAQSLPFDEGVFDLVLAQFGAMFFPDKVGAYREARRVLAPGRTLLFNVWDRLEANSGSAAIHHAVCNAAPEPKPEFIARTPFGYNDPATIETELRAAGFGEIAIERVERASPRGSAESLARGMCLGSPLANELAVHPADVREQALAAAIAAAELAETEEPLTMAALVVTATR